MFELTYVVRRLFRKTKFETKSFIDLKTCLRFIHIKQEILRDDLLGFEIHNDDKLLIRIFMDFCIEDSD